MCGAQFTISGNSSVVMCMEVANLDYADKVYCPEDGNNASLESFVDFNSNDYEQLMQYTP